jgi:hypothetical protein
MSSSSSYAWFLALTEELFDSLHTNDGLILEMANRSEYNNEDVIARANLAMPFAEGRNVSRRGALLSGSVNIQRLSS